MHNGTYEPKESKYPGIDFLDVADLRFATRRPTRTWTATGGRRRRRLRPRRGHEPVRGAAAGRLDQRRLERGHAAHARRQPVGLREPRFNPCKPFDGQALPLVPAVRVLPVDGGPPIGPNPPADSRRRAAHPRRPRPRPPVGGGGCSPLHDRRCAARPGPAAVVEGLPAGLSVTPEDIDRDLARRQLGHGRGGRMKIERTARRSRRGFVTAGPLAARSRCGSPISTTPTGRSA